MTAPRLTFAARVRFAWWFARYDLWEKSARRVSWAVVAAVALTTATAVVALTVPPVAAKIRLDRLAASPLARCVWVYAPRNKAADFTPARLDRLAAEVRTRSPGATVTVAGFHDVEIEFYERVGAGHPPRLGRTVADNDEIIPAIRREGRLVRDGKGLSAPDGPGVILSPTLVERLGWHPDHPPDEVRVLVGSSIRPTSWRVAGVTHDPLPLGHEFLLTEAEDDRLRASNADRRRKALSSGPLGPGWPQKWDDFPPRVGRLVTGWGLEADVRKSQAGAWVLDLAAVTAIPESTWLGYLRDIEKEMEERYGAAPEFARVPDDGRADAPPPEPRGAYPTATVYVRELADLRPAGDAARSLDLYANDSARSLVDEIEATAAAARRVAIGLVVGFCVAGAVTLVLALYLRGKQKAAQIGMLRAMGATHGDLWMVVVVEAAMLWALGTAGGLVVAALLGMAGFFVFDLTPAEVRAAAGAGWAGAVGLFLVVSLAACAGGNWAATRGVRRRPAAESLTLTS